MDSALNTARDLLQEAIAIAQNGSDRKAHHDTTAANRADVRGICLRLRRDRAHVVRGPPLLCRGKIAQTNSLCEHGQKLISFKAGTGVKQRMYVYRLSDLEGLY